MNRKGGVSIPLFHCILDGYESITHFTREFDVALYKSLPNLYAVWMADNSGDDKDLVAGLMLKTIYTHRDPEFIDVIRSLFREKADLRVLMNRHSSFLPSRLEIRGEAPLSEQEMLSIMWDRVTKFRAAHPRQEKLNVLFDAPMGYLLQAVVTPGENVTEGQIIEAVTYPWFKLVDLLVTDPNAVYQIDWRKWEEIIAGAYTQQGFKVILTPRSGDRGRDIIATSRGFGSVRYFDQVKAYSPNNWVTTDDVRAMIGVLATEGNVSKGIVTTTSTFAPGILADDNIKRLMPYRLELRPREKLLEWLQAITERGGNASQGGW